MVVQQPTVFWLQKLINFPPQGKIVFEQQQQNEQTSEEWKEQMMKEGKIKRDNRKDAVKRTTKMQTLICLMMRLNGMTSHYGQPGRLQVEPPKTE